MILFREKEDAGDDDDEKKKKKRVHLNANSLNLKLF